MKNVLRFLLREDLTKCDNALKHLYLISAVLGGFLFCGQAVGNFEGDEVYGCANINGTTATLEQCILLPGYSAFNTTAIVDNSSVEFSGAWSVTPMSANFHNDQLIMKIVGFNFYFGNLTFAFSDLDCSPACEIVDVSLVSIDGSPNPTGTTVKSLEFWADAILIVLQGNAVSTTVTATFDIVTIPTAPSFTCVGFEPPMANSPVTVKKNRALPLKAEIFDADGIVLTAMDLTTVPVVQVLYDAGAGGEPVDVTEDVLSAGHGSEGNQFAFTEEGYWQFNLKTKNYSAPGTYIVQLETGDESEYVLESTCQTAFVIE